MICLKIDKNQHKEVDGKRRPTNENLQYPMVESSTLEIPLEPLWKYAPNEVVVNKGPSDGMHNGWP